MTVKKQVAVVMGGAGGLGKSICMAFARAGYQVVIGDICEEPAKLVVKELIKIGADPMLVIVDVSRKADVFRMKEEIANKFGRTDVLVNIQGDNKNELLFKITEEQWKKTISVHLEGTLYSMLAFGSLMKERKYGRIINTSSIAARGSMAGGAYAAAKNGIEGLTKVAALEWSRYNITVNCLAPGLIGEGTMFTKTTPPEWQKLGIQSTPLKRAGKPQEVAAAALFLASEGAAFITGQKITIDGGLTSIGLGFGV